MTMSELIRIVAERNPHLYQRDVQRIVDTIFEEIVVALENGNRVELRRLGSFSIKHRTPREGRNPRTGEEVAIDEKWLPRFKASKDIHDRLNPGG